MRSVRALLAASLVVTSCADGPDDAASVDAAPPLSAASARTRGTLAEPSAQTLDELAREVAPLELVFAHSVTLAGDAADAAARRALPAGTQLDKYTFALGGVPVEGAGVRVLHDAAGGDRVVRAWRLGEGARAALRTPVISAGRAQAIALDGVARRPGRKRQSAPLARQASLAYVAQTHDDPADGAQVLDALRLTYQIEVADAPEELVAGQLAVVDASNGELVALRDRAMHATATGQGYFEASTVLQVEPTPLGSPTFPGWCLTDLTRGDAVVNTDPCGAAVGPGLQTFIELPGPERVERVVDSDTTFGDNVFPFDRAHAANEHGRTVAADAHHAIEVAYDFYRTVFGRHILAVNDSLAVHVNSTQLIWNAAFFYPATVIIGDRQLNGPQCPASSPDCSVPAADVEWLTHEYTHAVLAGELSQGGGATEFGALHEGISDVFAVLADGWWYTGPHLQGLVPPRNWIFADRIFPRPQGRQFAKPSLDGGGSIDAWSPLVPVNLANGTLGVHQAGGIVRRAYFFLALGIAPSGPGAPMPLPENVTGFVPEGLTGIGVGPAALILYYAIATQFDPGAAPSFTGMRNAMVAEARYLYGGQCAAEARATEDAWAGVGVGARADRTGPTMSVTATQVGAGVQVLGHAMVPATEEAPRVQLWLDGALLQDAVPVTLASTSGGQSDYLARPTDVALAALWPGPHTFELRGLDACANASSAATNLIADSAPPALLDLADTNLWRSSLRVFRVTAVDADVASYEVRVGGLSTGVVPVSGNVHSLSTTVQLDLSSLPGGSAPTLLIVRDRNGLQSTIQGAIAVDRDAPEACIVAGTISPTDSRAIVATLHGNNGDMKGSPIQILDVWWDGQPFFWTDRNYPIESPHWMMPQPFGGGIMTTTIPAVANGKHKLLGRCIDGWGNEADSTALVVMASPPTVTASASAQPGGFTVAATVTSLSTRINRVEVYDNNALAGTTSCGNVSLTCSVSRFVAAAPLTSHTVRVRGVDQAGRWGERTVTITIPLPPPPAISNVVKTGPARFPTFTVSASNASRVELLLGGTVLATATSAPYTFPMDLGGWATGSYSLELRARDDYGRSASSTYTLFADSTPPIVAVTVQGDHPPYLISASVLENSPYYVTFALDGATFATVNSGPYQTYYTPSGPGAHTLTVQAVDVFFNVASVDVAAPEDHDGPSVTLSFETGGGAHELIDLADGCGIAYPAQLYLDGVPVASLSTPTTTWPWTGLAHGHHVAAVDVSDQCGNQTFLESPFDYGDDPPVVNAIAVDSSMPKKPRLTIDATDDVAVTRVDVLRDGTLVASLSAAPWTVQLDTATWSDGNHTVTARAFDASGQTGERSVTVKADNTAPSVGLTAVHLGLGVIRWTATASDALSPVTDVAMSAPFNGFPTQHFAAPPYVFTTTIPATATQVDVWTSAIATDSFGNQRGISYVTTVHCTGSGTSRTCTMDPLTPG